jgi:ATP-binding cassette, subfamily B, bacterial
MRMRTLVPAALRRFRRAERRRGLLVEARQMLAPYRRRSGIALLSVLGALVTTLAGPSLVQYAIDNGLVNHHSMRVVDITGAAYVAVTIGSFFFTRWSTWLLSSTGELVLNDLRKRVFAHLLSQPLAFYDAESSGQLLSRMTADIDVLESLVQSGLGTLVMSIGLFFASIVVLLVISPTMMLVTAVCLIPVLVAAAHYRVTSTLAYTAVRARIGDTVAALDEGLGGVRVIQAFRREARVGKEFGRRNRTQFDSEMGTVALASRFFPKVEGSGVVATAAILLIGGFLVHEHLTSVGAVAAYVLYVANLFNSVQSLSQLFDLLQSSGAALGTVVDLLETEPSMVDPENPVSLPNRGLLELRSVSFAYGQTDDLDAAPLGDPPANAVLSDVSLAIEPGKHLVLVGPTGAGKSTLAKLIGRLYDPSHGSVRFAGVDLRRTSLAGLRERIVIVPQEGFLFRGTVMENILIGKPGAREDEALAAIDQLGLTKRLDDLPDGLDTDVGERGSHLSAGERQLLSLARAALNDPAVLVVDEATSSVDPGTALHVEQAFAALTEGRTTITVAHRLTIAQRADRVALIDDGNVVEVGHHDELVAADGAYAKLFAAWRGSQDPSPA